MSRLHRSGMLITLRLRPFLAIAGLLGLTTALVTPVPSSFDTRSGGAESPVLTEERCIALSYSDPAEAKWLPGVFRLQPTRVRVFDRAGHAGHRAIGFPSILGSDYSGWRHTGRDSIDIGWHHSPVLRLPSRILLSPENEVASGRAGNGQWTTLAYAFLERDGFSVQARAIPCTQVVPVT